MSCDQTRISNIEALLNSNPSSISTNDLIYYLKCNSNNSILDPNNLDTTKDYLNKINISFAYENVFVNTSNYSSIVTSIIGLSIPFYYFFPRFYKIGFLGTFIGIMSLFNLYSKTNHLYSPFFSSIGLVFLSLSMLIYIIFFILLNKLNHYSLFFISAILSFLIINYIVRFILTIPTKVNKWNQYNASMNSNNSSNYTEYNALLETTCFQVMSRFNMKLPSGNMLYSYLTVFEIGENPNKTKIADFLTNMFAPFISIFLLWYFGYFLAQLKDETIEDTKEKINLFPIIGIHDDSKKYYTCQANYILPKELNLGLLIHDHIDKYNFDDTLYSKVEKALTRISKELLQKYNPKFFKLEPINDNQNLKNNKIFKEEIYDNLRDNKIFKEIINLLKRNNLNLFEEISKNNGKVNKIQSGGNGEKENIPIVNNQSGSTPTVNDQNGSTSRINNQIGSTPTVNNQSGNAPTVNNQSGSTSTVNNQSGSTTRINNQSGNAPTVNNQIGSTTRINNQYNSNDNYISRIKEIINKQIIPYKRKLEMLGLVDHITNTLKIINQINEGYENDSLLARDELLYDKEIKDEQKTKLKEILDDYIDKFKKNLEIKDETLFGYHYNIVGYNLFGTNVRLKSNDIFSFILRLLSTWLLFAKPIGSPWIITKYIMSSSDGFKELLKNLSGTSLLWKYFSMGLDRSYFEEIYKGVVNNKENSIIKNSSLISSKGWNLFLTILTFIILVLTFFFYKSNIFQIILLCIALAIMSVYLYYKPYITFIFIIFIILMMLFYFYNSTSFGLTSSPSWYNMLYQIIFIIIITWNLAKYNDDKIPHNEKLISLLVLNRSFLIGSIILIILIFIIMLIIGAFQGK